MTHPENTKELAGKVALVTGGGSGIGEAIARALAGAGAAVAVSGRRREVLDSVVSSLEQAGASALAVPGDVASPRDAAAMVKRTVAELGGLHVLVNNAGIVRGGAIERMTEEDIDAVIDIDLKGPIHTLRAALPHLAAHGKGEGASVINISSSVSQTVVGNTSVYSAAKAGLDQLTRCLALDLADRGVRVNAICPGIVETPIFETVMSAPAARRYLRSAAKVTPLGRPGRPEDIAELALFLASPRSQWMTGSVLTLDGGISLAGNV
jgi:3-oxoacyl-[acyl-carrier protein] reductase